MLNLQELLIRGRFIFSDAPGRMEVFEHVNGRRNTQEIATELKRHVNNIRRDLNIIRDSGLIQPLLNEGKEVSRDGFPVYEKVPLARTIPIKYFKEPIKISRPDAEVLAIKAGKAETTSPKQLSVPTETDVLDIARNGEDQTHEFKSAGTDASKLAKEIGAMLNTRQGGMIFYGIDDDGTIVGSDVTRQELDQPLQNAIKTSISPAAVVDLQTVDVLGTPVLVIIVPPWDKKNVYQHNERILLRKGTNAMGARPEEVKSLHGGKYLV